FRGLSAGPGKICLLVASSSKIIASSGQAFAAFKISSSLSPFGSRTKALNFSSTSKTLGAMEIQLLCPLHLSLSMMIFISPLSLNPQPDCPILAESLDKVRRRSRRVSPAGKSAHIGRAARRKDPRLRATRSHDPKTPGAREPARPPAQRRDNQARRVVHPDPPVPSLHPRKRRQKLGHNPACEAKWNCAS